MIERYNEYVKKDNSEYNNHLKRLRVEELDHNYTSLNEFCWVHKTNYLPQNSVIKTTNNSTLKKDNVSINGKSYEYEYSNISRNTVHGAINSEVSSHEYGSWDNCKYAIIIPFTDMPLNNLKNFNVVDTYFESDIKIPSSAIILCPKEEMKKVKENNPNVNIVGYTGKSNVTDFANRMVYLSGYRYETVEKYGWQNLTNQKRAKSVVLNNGFSTGKHFGTNENIKERALKGLKKFVKILEIIENNNLVNNDNLYDIFNQLKKQNVLKSEDSFNEIKYLEKLGYIDSNLAIKLNQAVMENDNNLDDALIMESLKTLANKSK